MSEISSLERVFDRHAQEDRENFDKLFDLLRKNGEDTAVLIRRADDAERLRRDDKEQIMEGINNLNTAVGNIKVVNAEAKGIFSTLKIPSLMVIGSMIGAVVSKYWK